jgi:hypothetical protein
MIFNKKLSIKLLLILLFINLNVFAQQNNCTITFISNNLTNNNYNSTKITIVQNDIIIKGRVNEKLVVYKGIQFDVEFSNENLKIPGIKKLQIFKDTVVDLSTKTMEGVTIRSKRKVVTETLQGFEYFPQNDSVYKGKSLFLSLQRLPFITIEKEILKYKNESKILFLINGKQRKGIENNWTDVLKKIQAKDIYKIEMLEDIPAYAKNQGYIVVINILTLDKIFMELVLMQPLYMTKGKMLTKVQVSLD